MVLFACFFVCVVYKPLFIFYFFRLIVGGLRHRVWLSSGLIVDVLLLLLYSTAPSLPKTPNLAFTDISQHFSPHYPPLAKHSDRQGTRDLTGCKCTQRKIQVLWCVTAALSLSLGDICIEYIKGLFVVALMGPVELPQPMPVAIDKYSVAPVPIYLHCYCGPGQLI